jgi:hypothetical protein
MDLFEGDEGHGKIAFNGFYELKLSYHLRLLAKFLMIASISYSRIFGGQVMLLGEKKNATIPLREELIIS